MGQMRGRRTSMARQGDVRKSAQGRRSSAWGHAALSAEVRPLPFSVMVARKCTSRSLQPSAEWGGGAVNGGRGAPMGGPALYGREK